MKKASTSLLAFLSILVMTSCTQADALDTTLAAAGKDGRAVMLELGSVGCVSCEQMKPVMAKLSDEYKGRLEIIFVDVRQDKQAARRFGVYMIPTQVFLDRNGKEFHRHIGYFAYEDIVLMLKKAGF